jgi:hypothetical protein
VADVVARNQIVGALLDRVAAEQARGAAQRTAMDVQQEVERAVLVFEHEATGKVAIAFEVLRIDRLRIVVLDPVVATLKQAGHAEAQVVGDRRADGGLDVGGVEAAPRGADMAVEVFGRALGGQLDHTGRRVATKQRALRALSTSTFSRSKTGKALSIGLSSATLS